MQDTQVPNVADRDQEPRLVDVRYGSNQDIGREAWKQIIIAVIALAVIAAIVLWFSAS